MQIQFNTDHNIEGSEGLASYVDDVIDKVLSPVCDHITRIEVHLTDESSNKNTPHDKRCVIEARLESHQPIAVIQEASTVDEAVEGAANKLARRVDHVIGRLESGEPPNRSRPRWAGNGYEFLTDMSRWRAAQ